MAKRIVIQGDDWGYTQASIDGVCEAYRHGILTETDIMANLLNPEKKSEYHHYIDGLENESGLTKPKIGLGVHLNLTFGHPITSTWPFQDMARPYKGTGKSEEWQGSAWTKFFSTYDPVLIKDEFKAQLERALDIFGNIDHLDSHHFIHSYQPIKSVVMELAKEYGIAYIRAAAPLSETPIYGGDFVVDSNFQSELHKVGLKTTDKCFLKLYWNETNPLKAFLADVEAAPDNSTTEFMVHPAAGGTEEWRNKDLAMLTSPETIQAFKDMKVELINYSQI